MLRAIETFKKGVQKNGPKMAKIANFRGTPKNVAKMSKITLKKMKKTRFFVVYDMIKSQKSRFCRFLSLFGFGGRQKGVKTRFLAIFREFDHFLTTF